MSFHFIRSELDRMVCCIIAAGLLALGLGVWRGGASLMGFRFEPASAWRPDAERAEVSTHASWAALRIRSFGYAIQGLHFTLRSQPNAQIHAVATLAVVTAGIAIDLPVSDWSWLSTAIVLVWAAELINTAIEQLCDVVSPEPNPNIKNAKDAAAAGVLACAVFAAVTSLLIFGPYVLGGVSEDANSGCQVVIG